MATSSAPEQASFSAKLSSPALPPRRRRACWFAASVAVLAALLACSSSFTSLTSLSSFVRPAAPAYGPPERVIAVEALEQSVVLEGRSWAGWVAIDRQVWDVTNTIAKHPAGPSHIIKHLGSDITKQFHEHHHREGLLGTLEMEPDRIKRVGVLARP
ncbi:hypothetical protein JCM10213_004533 [Rhodosporidiobolus nylandii]